MSSAKDLCRDIDCDAGLYHVSPKGSVHNGPSRLCTWCRPLSDGDRGIFLSPAAVEPLAAKQASGAVSIKDSAAGVDGDGAMERCGMRFGAYPPVRSSPYAAPSNPWPRVRQIEAAQYENHPAMQWMNKWRLVLLGVIAVAALILFVVQVAMPRRAPVYPTQTFNR
jgi:hypothetical protein